MQNTSRLPELDYIRAIAMIMVVMGHVLIVCLNNSHTSLISLITFCEMPLFFAVSGYLVNLNNSDNIFECVKNFFKRSQSLLIPLFVWSFLRNMAERGGVNISLSMFYRSGYWFFYALLWCLFLVTFTNCIIIILKKFKPAFEIILYTAIYLIFIFLQYKDINIGRIVPLHDIVFYFPFYVMGIIIRKIKFCQDFFFGKYLYALALILFLVCWKTSLIWDSFFIWIIGAFCSVVVVWNACKIINPTKSVSKVLEAIGRNTLAIYAIHYFFIIPLPDEVRNIMILQDNFFLQFVISFSYALAAIALSLLADRLLSSNSITRYLFFGEKKKRVLIHDREVNEK